MRSNNHYTRDGNNDRPPRIQHQQNDNNHQVQRNANQHPLSSSGCYNRQRVTDSARNLTNNNVSINIPSQSFLTSQEPRQTIIHHFHNSLNQPLSISSNAITDGNALNSNSAMPVTYINNINNRLVLHSHPLHSNSAWNEPISITANQPNPTSNTASLRFDVSGARIVNPPMTVIHPPFQHNQQQFIDHRVSDLSGNVSSQLIVHPSLHSTNANAMRIITDTNTNTNQITVANTQIPLPQYTSTSNEIHVHRNRSTRSKLIASSNDRGNTFKSSNNILTQADGPIKSSYDDDDVCSASSDSSSDIQRRRERFPYLLYRLLIDAESNGFTEIVSFLPHGRAFAVHRRFMFEEMVMPMYFSNKQFSSFRRYDCLIVNVIVVHVFGLYPILNICFMDGKAIEFIRLCANEEGETIRYVLSSQLCSRKSGYVIGKYKICLMISELT